MTDDRQDGAGAPSRFTFTLALDGDSHVAGATPDATQDSAIDDAQTLLETAVEIVAPTTASCRVMDGSILIGTWRWADGTTTWTRRG